MFTCSVSVDLNQDSVIAHLERTALKAASTDAYQACFDSSTNVNLANIRNFAISGIEADLVAETSDGNEPPSPDSPEGQLVTSMREFVLLNCLRIEVEDACVEEANCQLANIGTLYDQCPVYVV